MSPFAPGSLLGCRNTAVEDIAALCSAPSSTPNDKGPSNQPPPTYSNESTASESFMPSTDSVLEPTLALAPSSACVNAPSAMDPKTKELPSIPREAQRPGPGQHGAPSPQLQWNERQPELQSHAGLRECSHYSGTPDASISQGSAPQTLPRPTVSPPIHTGSNPDLLPGGVGHHSGLNSETDLPHCPGTLNEEESLNLASIPSDTNGRPPSEGPLLKFKKSANGIVRAVGDKLTKMVDISKPPDSSSVHRRVDSPPPVDSPRTAPTSSFEPSTVVFFGTTGVGKSSVINMLPDAEADAPRAAVSNSSSGVTTEARSYSKIIDARHFLIYDTAGMGEGTTGTVPTHEAIQRFYNLLKGQKAGIHLIVFVIRGGRLTKMEENNHRLIKLLAPRVPLALVITGLEYEEDMDGWWEKQKGQFVKYDFAVDYHAPVVATRGKGDLLGQQYEDSQVNIRDLLSRATHQQPAIVVGEKQWFTSFHKEVQAVINDSGLGRGRIVDFSEEIRKLLKKYQEKENASGRTMMRNPLSRLRPNTHREDSSRRSVTE